MKSLGRMSVLALLVSLVFFGCSNNDPPAVKEAKEKLEKEYIVQKILDRIIYLKDARSMQCFAYFWDTGLGYWGRQRAETIGQGGPAFATVPCEKVEYLLVNK